MEVSHAGFSSVFAGNSTSCVALQKTLRLKLRRFTRTCGVFPRTYGVFPRTYGVFPLLTASFPYPV